MRRRQQGQGDDEFVGADDVGRRVRGRHPRTGPRHRERGLHLRLPDGRQLPDPVLLLRRLAQPGVQGRLEPGAQHRPGLHTRRHRGPDAELRHPVLDARRGPAHRAAGADHPADRAGPLLLGAVRRRLHLQLRLPRQPHHRQQRRHLPAGRTGVEGREARRRQRGHPGRHRLRAGHLSHPTVRPRRPGQRQEHPGRLHRQTAVGVPEPAGAGGRPDRRLPETR